MSTQRREILAAVLGGLGAGLLTLVLSGLLRLATDRGFEPSWFWVISTTIITAGSVYYGRRLRDS